MATDTKMTTTGSDKKPKPAVKRVKMAIPFAIQCGNCRRPTKKGVKYWGLKEEAGFDSSLEIEIYRFRFKCLCCSADFSIKSDPGRYDYVLEAGATLLPNKF